MEADYSVGNTNRTGRNPLLAPRSPHSAIERGPYDSSKSEQAYVVELFAVWCPHCQREVAPLIQLQQVDGARVDIIAIPAKSCSKLYDTGVHPPTVRDTVLK